MHTKVMMMTMELTKTLSTPKQVHPPTTNPQEPSERWILGKIANRTMKQTTDSKSAWQTGKLAQLPGHQAPLWPS
jgi:hypothetical protein